MGRSLWLMLAPVLLAGCVSTEVRMIDERSAIISGGGNAYTSMAAVEDGIMYRAAVETRARGFDYFAIMNSRDTSAAGQIAAPSMPSSDTTASLNCYGQHCSGTAHTTYSGGGGSFSYVKPGQDVMVRFYRASEVNPNARGLWNADSIIAAHPEKAQKKD